VEREQLRQRLAQRPNAVRFSELERLLEMYGWSLDRVRGSHHIFRKEDVTTALVVPMRRPHLLRVYVQQVLAALESEE
jgi:predicted RNA binding protein YcfA (HicA-like mRNA interferase family)